MKTKLIPQLVRAFCIVSLLISTSAAELRAQNENAPPPQRRGPARGDAAGLVDPNAKPALTGRVVDDRSQPVTDALLTLIPTLPSPDPNGVMRLRAVSARTDANGNYAVVGITPADEYRVQIRSQMAVGISSSAESPRIRLSPDAPTSRDFTLQRACQIRVQVVNELLEPVPQARLQIGAVGERRAGATSQLIRTNAAGVATLGGVAPSDADYLIAATVDGYALGKLITKLNDVDKPATGMIMLSKGQDLQGTAICSDGKPAAGWRVSALPEWWTFPSSPVGVDIDADGVFTLRNIAAGDKYTIHVSIPSGDSTFRRKTVAESVALLPRNEPFVLKIAEPSPGSTAAISGTVRFTGPAPTSVIHVSANPIEGAASASGLGSVRDGKFRIAPLPPGRYTLRFESAEVEEKTIPNVAAPSENVAVELVARGKLMFRGVAVRANSGEPLNQFRIRVAKVRELHGNYNGQPERWYDINNATGEFEIELAAPGIYQALIAADGLAWTRSEKVNTDENKGALVRVAVAQGVTLSGSVVDEQGQPIEGATVLPASRATGAYPREYSQFTLTDGSVQTVAGSFALEHLEPGLEKLKVTHPDFTATVTENIEVAAEGTIAAPIVLRDGGTIRGRVYDAEGRLQRGVTLYVRDTDSSSYPGDTRGLLGSVTTNAEGEYEVRHLPDALCYVSRRLNQETLGVASVAIRPRSGKALALDFGGETPVAGRLIVSRVPLANARVQLSGSSEYFGNYIAIAQTDNAGNFIFWSPPPGKRFLYYSTGERRGEWLRVREVQVTGEPIDLGEIEFTPRKLSVRIDAMPDPAAGRVNINLERLINSQRAIGAAINPTRLSTSATTPFEFATLSPGQYDLSASLRPLGNDSPPKSTLSIRAQVEITEKQDQEVTLRWPQGTAVVRGRIASGVGIKSDRPCAIVSKDRHISVWFSLEPDNSFEFAGLPAGDYFISSTDSSRAIPLFEFSLADGETKSIEITAEAIARATPDYAAIRLHTYSSAGLSLPGCSISFAGEGRLPTEYFTSDDYALYTADPGEYEMVVIYPGFEPVRRKVAFIPASKKPSLDQYQIDVVLEPTKKQ